MYNELFDILFKKKIKRKVSDLGKTQVGNKKHSFRSLSRLNAIPTLNQHSASYDTSLI